MNLYAVARASFSDLLDFLMLSDAALNALKIKTTCTSDDHITGHPKRQNRKVQQQQQPQFMTPANRGSIFLSFSGRKPN